MTPRVYDRLAAGVSVALLLILAAGTYFLAQFSLRDTGPAVARALTHDPDYFVEDLVFTRINTQGDPVFRFRPPGCCTTLTTSRATSSARCW